ncbi:MAG TPA: hypothetical protein PLH90_00890 [Candidatus Paceibacterota bacterium]|jgi:hypothetical protein|nr:hypothetical protein [Candidatus Paceibacterota bacterium]HPI66662.1 hypothetical protein [Candidatus Paceibacterota bacterium]HQO70858.1 hypothetical protein [Candidatus Paceibacterota bacterium]
MNKITFLSIIFSMLLIGLGAITPSQVVLAEEEMVNCTMDAFLCPDGTWVGRTGPLCQFVCPGEEIEEEKEAKENTYRIDNILEKIKNKREDFKLKFDRANSGLLKISDSPVFGIEKIGDINKRNAVLKIINGIQELNTKYVESLSLYVNKIEDILAKVDVKIGEKKEALEDTILLEEKSIALNNKIDLIREEIIKQAKTHYTMAITDENLIKDDITAIRDGFKENINNLFITTKEIKNELRLLALMLVEKRGNEEEEVVVDESVVEIINNIDQE